MCNTEKINLIDEENDDLLLLLENKKALELIDNNISNNSTKLFESITKKKNELTTIEKPEKMDVQVNDQSFQKSNHLNNFKKNEIDCLISQSKVLLSRTKIFLKSNFKRTYSPKEIELKKIMASITLNVNKIKRLHNFN